MKPSHHLQAVLDTIPTKTGCYLMKNASGKVIYVGKGVNLRSRVRSYFHNSANHHIRTARLVKNISDIEWIVVDTELEALILEMNLIKKHRPRYNVRLKDDKRYPYIKIHWGDSFPKVTVTRNMVQEGSRYFGPYTSVWAVHQTLDLLRRIFPYLTCNRVITGADKRACLYRDIKLCTAPCTGEISKEDYRQMVNDLCQFLMGRTEHIVSRLRSNMEKAAEDLDYERAASLRNQIQAIENVVEKQKVISAKYVDSDVIAMARADGDTCVQIFFIRGGKLIGRDYFLLEGTEDTPDKGVIAEFIKQFYNKASSIPTQVLLPHEVEEAQIIKQWLRQKHGNDKIEILVPRRGQQKDLIKMAAKNAAEILTSLRARWEADRHHQTEALAEIREALDLPTPANRIECYDISNIQGTSAVGSMVVFEQGVPKKNHYRRFNIRTVTGPDDYASMEEVLQRRFSRWQSTQASKESPGGKPDPSFSALPNLVLVDGGKGQLSRAVSVLEQFNLQSSVPIAGLAKQNEELFIPNQSRSIVLPQKTQGLYLIQRIRDEAHRFAISAHRKLRTTKGLASRLDAVPGIGPAKRGGLLKHFGSIAKIQSASLEELSAVHGISKKLAKSIMEYLE